MISFLATNINQPNVCHVCTRNGVPHKKWESSYDQASSTSNWRRPFKVQFVVFNARNLRILTQKCSICEKSRQIMASVKIHGFHEFAYSPSLEWGRLHASYATATGRRRQKGYQRCDGHWAPVAAAADDDDDDDATAHVGRCVSLPSSTSSPLFKRGHNTLIRFLAILISSAHDEFSARSDIFSTSNRRVNTELTTDRMNHGFASARKQHLQITATKIMLAFHNNDACDASNYGWWRLTILAVFYR